MKLVVLSGGVGGAKFLRGLREHLQLQGWDESKSNITAVVNVADDKWMNGLRLSADLDSVMYTLAGESDELRGWGRSGDTERVSAELEAYGLGYDWFTLGDLDVATHLARTMLLKSGFSLTEVTKRLCSRWELGVDLLPATDDEVETRVHTVDGIDMHFQEWWVRYRALKKADRFEFRGSKGAGAGPRVLKAILEADRVILAPSNPVVSIGAILSVPGIADAIRASKARVVGVSPIIAGSAVRGMAGACLAAIGVESNACAVGLHYGARKHGGLIDGWLVDESDSQLLGPLREGGIHAQAVPLWMHDLQASERLASAAMKI